MHLGEAIFALSNIIYATVNLMEIIFRFCFHSDGRHKYGQYEMAYGYGQHFGCWYRLYIYIFLLKQFLANWPSENTSHLNGKFTRISCNEYKQIILIWSVSMTNIQNANLLRGSSSTTALLSRIVLIHVIHDYMRRQIVSNWLECM